MISVEPTKSSSTASPLRLSVSPSKSILNRLLLIQSYEPNLKVRGDSLCDDVQMMRKALIAFRQGQPIDCGLAGTVLRFMILRASRQPGEHIFKVHKRLAQRPRRELTDILSQLGVNINYSDTFVEAGEVFEEWRVYSPQGWSPPPGSVLQISVERSSQFASAVLLNCWDLPFKLIIQLMTASSPSFSPSSSAVEPSLFASEGYWQLSWKLMQTFGAKINILNEFSTTSAIIHSTSNLKSLLTVEVESLCRIHCHPAEPYLSPIDHSSAFAVAALAIVLNPKNGVSIDNFSPLQYSTCSWHQPDEIFVSYLQQMGANLFIKGNNLQISATPSQGLHSIQADLRSSPDLFPVLSALCGLAHGRSILRGSPHLIYKESNRLQRMAELLRLAGIRVHAHSDGLEIDGIGWKPKPHYIINNNNHNSLSQLCLTGDSSKEFIFDPDQDHRLAFAAAVMRESGVLPNLIINQKNVVQKSFPEFWDILEQIKSCVSHEITK